MQLRSGESGGSFLAYEVRISLPPGTLPFLVFTNAPGAREVPPRPRNVTPMSFDFNQIGTARARYKKAASGKELKKMGRLPYDKQHELAYHIYEALCAQHPDWLVALSDTRAAFEKRAAVALTTRPPSGEESEI